ncbi:hypothetical protein PLICRDRAFT_180781 [Plicaturopsis crispa FD-325 SS-3]|uniref:Uncharacterized protein n=1 Tax=Plicaturopsis crispa FD-325 SS-3 TaxID=944288 RepID=A0A0C9T4L3_PLICR|nr:hypothetical protein PLICRDRAFT_180781 [Plicaturopsis crispa FD-325 SS-3]
MSRHMGLVDSLVVRHTPSPARVWGVYLFSFLSTSPPPVLPRRPLDHRIASHTPNQARRRLAVNRAVPALHPHPPRVGSYTVNRTAPPSFGAGGHGAVDGLRRRRSSRSPARVWGVSLFFLFATSPPPDSPRHPLDRPVALHTPRSDTTHARRRLRPDPLRLFFHTPQNETPFGVLFSSAPPSKAVPRAHADGRALRLPFHTPQDEMPHGVSFCSSASPSRAVPRPYADSRLAAPPPSPHHRTRRLMASRFAPQRCRPGPYRVPTPTHESLHRPPSLYNTRRRSASRFAPQHGRPRPYGAPTPPPDSLRRPSTPHKTRRQMASRFPPPQDPPWPHRAHDNGCTQAYL